MQAGSHTDFETITLLFARGAGLEVCPGRYQSNHMFLIYICAVVKPYSDWFPHSNGDEHIRRSLTMDTFAVSHFALSGTSLHTLLLVCCIIQLGLLTELGPYTDMKWD